MRRPWFFGVIRRDKAILSREPIRDEERLKKLLIFDREDFKTYRRQNSFSVNYTNRIGTV